MKLSKKSVLRLLIAVVVVTLLITYVLPWATSMQAGAAEASLSIAFEGAGNGLDPQGNRFNINEVKSEAVLKAAIEASGLENQLTAEELQKRIYILPYAQEDTLKELLTLTTINGKTQDIREQIVYPTTFQIGLQDTGFPSVISDQKLLTHILQAYTDYLESKYLADTAGEPAYSKEEILAMDYPEMVKVVNQGAESLLRYIGTYTGNEPQFVSGKSGLSFGDIYQKALILQNTDIATMRSLVSFYRLTEDAQTRILYEETMLKRAGVVAGKLQGAEYTVSDIIQIYDNNSNFVFASGDNSTVNLAPVENQFYSDLMDTLVGKQTSFIDAKYNQQDILDAIDKLQNSVLTGEAYQQQCDTIRKDAGKALDQIEALRKQTMTMAREYYDENVGSKILVSNTSYHFYSLGNPLINFFVLAGLTALAIVLFTKLKKSRYFFYLEMVRNRFRRQQ